jgi:hypothetical protein
MSVRVTRANVFTRTLIVQRSPGAGKRHES